MSDNELRALLEEFGERLDQCSVQIERKNENNNGWLKAVFSALVGLMLMFIFYGGGVYRDIQTLKDNSIPKDAWRNNEYKTNASYNKVFNIPIEYQTRGGDK